MLNLNKKFDESVIIPDIIQLLPKDFIKQDTSRGISKKTNVESSSE